MAFRKYAGDKIFTGEQWYGSGHAVIADPSGKIEGIVPLADAGPDVQFVEGIISPGFVNCHVHLELSHLRGKIDEGGGMAEFLMSVIRQRQQDPVLIREAVNSALDEMFQNGIVGAGDICNTAESILPKQGSPILIHHFIEAIGSDPSLAKERYTQSRRLLESFQEVFPGRCSIVPHTLYTVSPALMQLIASTQGNSLLSAHSQESQAEEQFLRSGSGPLRSLFGQLNIDASEMENIDGSLPGYLLSYFSRQQTMILVHNVTTSASDILYLKAHQQVLPPFILCLCPRANMFIGNGLPDIPLLERSGFPIVLGTDSLASNHSLSILEEMRVIHHHFPGIPLEKLFSWATFDGARALQMHDKLGSLAPGMRPGLICCTHDLTRVTRLL